MAFPRRATVRSRGLALGGAVALALPLLPITAAGAATPPPLQDIREFACPPGQVPDAGFTDTQGNTFEFEIDCLAAYGITTGVTATTYQPGEEVRRSQMALFIARLATDVAGLTLDARDAGFTDIGDLNQDTRDAINGLANAGIVSGTTATTFSPLDDVRREQMATFIAQLQENVGEVFPIADDFFDDDSESVHQDNINRLATAGIVAGTGGGGYTPRGLVTRQQMSGFLMRYVEDRVEAGDFDGFFERDNEVLPVTPGSRETRGASADDSGADDPADNREYTATGLAEGVEYRITLLEASTVRLQAGITRFTDSDNDNLAEVGSYGSDIIAVNGEPVARTAGAPSTTTARPSNGRITFTVDGSGDDVVRPVIYTNGGGSPRLELAADDRPIEVFGLGGTTEYGAPAATAEDSNRSGEVTVADKASDEVTIATDRGELVYSYDDSDSFAVGGDTVTFSVFEAELSRGDTVDVGNYSTNPIETSVFDISTDTPGAPASVSAEKGTEAQTTDDISVTVSGGTPNPFDGYIIQRAPVNAPPPGNADEQLTPPGTTGTFATVSGETPVPAGQDADPATAGFQFVFVDENVPAGSFRYRAIGVVDGDQSNPTADPRNETSVTPAVPDVTRPFSRDALANVDTGLPGVVSFGDELAVVFNERLASLNSGDQIAVTDADGTSARLINQENVLFRLNTGTTTVNGESRGAGRVLFIDVGPDVDTTGGTVPGLQFPLTITEQAGITDQAGLTFDLSTSLDLLIDRDADDTDAGGPDS
jgi:hypothetical protein